MHVLCVKYQAQCYGGLKIKTMILRKSCTRESDIKKDNPTHMCRKLDLKNAHCCFTFKKNAGNITMCNNISAASASQNNPKIQNLSE